MQPTAAEPAEPLFDGYERTNADPPLYSESTYAFLNRAAGDRWSKIRALLEEWYSHYPDENKADLRGAFTVSIDSQHVGAWWELYIFSLYRHLGYEIEIHPEVTGTTHRPDFLVTRDGESKYVECTVDSKTDRQVTGNPGIEAAILDAVNAIDDGNFLVGLQFRQEGQRHPRRKQIIRDIGNWLRPSILTT